MQLKAAQIIKLNGFHGDSSVLKGSSFLYFDLPSIRSMSEMHVYELLLPHCQIAHSFHHRSSSCKQTLHTDLRTLGRDVLSESRFARMGLGIVNPRGHPDDDPDMCVPGTVVFKNTDVQLNNTNGTILSPLVSRSTFVKGTHTLANFSSGRSSQLAIMEKGYCPNNFMRSLHHRGNVLFHFYMAVLTFGRLSSILATNTLTLVFIFSINFTQVAGLTGYFLLGVGCSSWITSASACIYGKRHTYVFGAILLLAGSIWGACGASSIMGTPI